MLENVRVAEEVACGSHISDHSRPWKIEKRPKENKTSYKAEHLVVVDCEAKVTPPREQRQHKEAVFDGGERHKSRRLNIRASSTVCRGGNAALSICSACSLFFLFLSCCRIRHEHVRRESYTRSSSLELGVCLPEVRREARAWNWGFRRVDFFFKWIAREIVCGAGLREEGPSWTICARECRRLCN